MTEATSLGGLAAAGWLVINDGYRTKKPELGMPGVPVLRVAEVQDGYITPTFGDHVSEDYRSKFGNKTSVAGDVIVTTKGTVGRVALITPRDPEFIYSPQLCFFRVLDSSRIDRGFLYQWFRGAEFRQQASGVQSQTDMAPYINLADMRSLNITLPPLPEQRAIAEVLGALDDKSESNRRVVQNVMKLSTTLFNKWRSTVSDWNITTFGEFASVYGGATPKTGSPEYWDGPHCWLTPTDVTHLDSIYLSSSARTITDEGLASASTEVHPPGTILMTSRATIGAFAVNQVPCAPNQGFIAVRPANAGQRWFLFHEMSRRVPEMLDRANGTTFREISRGSFKSMELLVPDDDNAFGRLDSELSPLHERAAQAVSETSCLAATRDTLLPALLSGRIQVPAAAELVEAS